jgi:hypothetical protein
MARKKGRFAKRVLGILSISHLYVIGVIALIVVLGYPFVRGTSRLGRHEADGLAFDIRVTVLNGCGTQGVAEDVAFFLREAGFDIVGTGNADAFDYERTLVVDRCGSPDKVDRVSRALKCRNVLTQRVASPASDVIVVVGSDWRDLRPGAQGRYTRSAS